MTEVISLKATEKMIAVKKSLGNSKTFYYSSIINEEIDFDVYYHVEPQILKKIVHDKDFVEKNSTLEKICFYAPFWGFSTIHLWDIDKECWYAFSINPEKEKKKLELENIWIKKCCEFLY